MIDGKGFLLKIFRSLYKDFIKNYIKDNIYVCIDI